MKKLVLLFALFAAAGVAMAQPSTSVNTSILYETDTEKTDITTVKSVVLFDVNENWSIGPSVSHSQYSFNRKDRTSRNRIGLAAEYHDGTLTMSSDIGATGSTLTGNIDLRYMLTDTAAAFGGIERGIVVQRLRLGPKEDPLLVKFGDISTTNYYFGSDFETAVIGGSLMAGVVHYSGGTVTASFDRDSELWDWVERDRSSFDSNRRKYVKARVFAPIAEGVYVYVRSHHYVNSNPNIGAYFSPRRYTQTLTGVSFKQPLLGGVLSGHIDTGRQKVAGSSSPSGTWKLAFTTPVANNARITAHVSQDRNQPGYTYTTSFLSLVVDF